MTALSRRSPRYRIDIAATAMPLLGGDVIQAIGVVGFKGPGVAGYDGFAELGVVKFFMVVVNGREEAQQEEAG